jgi:hypothetical protein
MLSIMLHKRHSKLPVIVSITTLWSRIYFQSTVVNKLIMCCPTSDTSVMWLWWNYGFRLEMDLFDTDFSHLHLFTFIQNGSQAIRLLVLESLVLCHRRLARCLCHLGLVPSSWTILSAFCHHILPSAVACASLYQLVVNCAGSAAPQLLCMHLLL